MLEPTLSGTGASNHGDDEVVPDLLDCQSRETWTPSSARQDETADLPVCDVAVNPLPRAEVSPALAVPVS